jgi:dephospho-CoA kinase
MRTNSSRTGPYIIGLTGAIGTGKSLVRKMLEHKGALTIDADHLAHGAYGKGTKGCREIISHFGIGFLDSNGQIDRNRLGELVFTDPEALAELEDIIHPLVILAVKRLITLSTLPIIVVEAIKLLESDLKDLCDTIWAVTSSQENIYKRLKDARGMDRSQVDGRLRQQFIRYHSDTDIDMVIPNYGSIRELGLEVSSKWDKLSEQSEKFTEGFAKTSDLMKPFQNYLVRSDNGIWEKSSAKIKKKGMFFLPVDRLTIKREPDASINSNLLDSEEVSVKYYLWKSKISSREILYMVSDMENFIASAAISAGNVGFEAFTKIMELVQNFSRLHLCENLFIPLNNENESLGVPLGFRKNCPEFVSTPSLDSLGYSLLCKKLREPLKLFDGS